MTRRSSLTWPFRKHEQRHHKRHACTVDGCNRQNQPFSTINDLERHRKSVHKQDDSGPTWQCIIPGCLNNGKIWPRADNFRQHLKRIHKWDAKATLDIKPFIVQSGCLDQSAANRCPLAGQKETGAATAATVTPGKLSVVTGGRSDSPTPPNSACTSLSLSYDVIEPSDVIWPSLDRDRSVQAEDGHHSSEAVDCLDEQPHLIAPELASHMSKALQALQEQACDAQSSVTANVDSSSVSLLETGALSRGELHMQPSRQHMQPSHQHMQNAFALDLGPSTFHGSIDESVGVRHDHSAPIIAPGLDVLRPQGALSTGPLSDNLGDIREQYTNASTRTDLVTDWDDSQRFDESNLDDDDDEGEEEEEEEDEEEEDEEEEDGEEEDDEDEDADVIPEPVSISQHPNVHSSVDGKPSKGPDISFPSSATGWLEDPDRGRLFDFLSTIPRSIMDMFCKQRAREPNPRPDCGHEPGVTYKCRECPKSFSRRCDLK